MSLPPAPLTRVALAALQARPSDRLRDPLVLPYVSDTRPPGVAVSRDASTGAPSRIVSGADLIASAFFWISRYEETLIRERDEFGRIPQKLLRQVQEGITDRPLVDEYAELLAGWLETLGSGVRFHRQPFRALITHDVDSGIGIRGIRENLENGLRTLYREAIRGKRLGTGLIGLGDWALKGSGFGRRRGSFAASRISTRSSDFHRSSFSWPTGRTRSMRPMTFSETPRDG